MIHDPEWESMLALRAGDLVRSDSDKALFKDITRNVAIDKHPKNELMVIIHGPVQQDFPVYNDEAACMIFIVLIPSGPRWIRVVKSERIRPDAGYLRK